MNRRKFLDLLKFGGAAAAVAPAVGWVNAAADEKPEDEPDYVLTVEPGEKYVDDTCAFTSMSSPVVKLSNLNCPGKW